ncbi:MAG TPA: tetratricopeptide repeat protein [Burkholderiales bacterium]|nr:tetratricopeptide repeat protein [Burkholderiales bacterium]
MSLLLEALKKAEKAKEEAQRRSRAEGGEPELQIGAATPAAEASQPVLTRDKLPEISQPLEIVADDLQPPKPAPASSGARQEPRPEPRLKPGASAQRAVARKVFEAKFREPNPRLPFYVTVGVLGVFALGTVGYFWLQLRPAPPLVIANPPRSPNEPMPVQVASVTSQSAPAAQAPVIPGLPASIPAVRPQAAPVPRQAPRSAPPPAELRPRPAPRPAARPVQPSEAPRLPPLEQRALPAAARIPQVNPNVQAGYAAWLGGDLMAARTRYEEALREEPANRDALLGMAAIDVKAGRYESAEATYLRLLQADPRDADAQAALMALRGARLDPLVAESRVKSLLAAAPDSHALHFTLGNQLAQQGRWAEAQQQYFKAFSAEPENADFAYNLAVALDQLRQPRLAIEYYRRAIALAERRGASFDLGAARSRALHLGP